MFQYSFGHQSYVHPYYDDSYAIMISQRTPRQLLLGKTMYSDQRDRLIVSIRQTIFEATAEMANKRRATLLPDARFIVQVCGGPPVWRPRSGYTRVMWRRADTATTGTLSKQPGRLLLFFPLPYLSHFTLPTLTDPAVRCSLHP
ncbi:hypothetical protein BaRGS_00010511 [Batillaria attramentaria]|uniref:Uncharacterized protein n=1 Tax=Batillaria attramentaria TaxID=370345 RepID=A0ABD0LFH3_9CAEN